MSNNQKEKFLSNKFIRDFIDNEKNISLVNDEKFIEIASSLSYYLKSFSNVKRFLEYISLISKHIFEHQLILIIPLTDNGEIWQENIQFAGDLISPKNDKIKIFFEKLNLSKNFKIKEISIFENYLKNNFKDFEIESHKIISRGKCRGFLYFFAKDLMIDTVVKKRNLNLLLNCLAVGLENYWLIKIKKMHENVDREISTGAEIQSQLLPDFCPIIFGIDLAAHCRPALQLGGDYYDFMSLKANIAEKRREKGRWALVIGDVMGKGIPAGLLMTMLRGMLRAEVMTGLPPDRILYDLNQLALYDLDQSHRFVTLFYSDYDPRTKKLRYSNAAHNPPLLWKSSEQKIIKLDAEGFVLGLQKDANYQCCEIKLNHNDIVLYYTDGVTDTFNSQGERFDENRLINTFTKLCKRSLSSKEILNKIFKTLDNFTGINRHLEDDASIVVFQVQ